MFQVVLLAGERQIMEKEKFGGVSPMAYLASKVVFLMAIILVQSLVMGFAVEVFWNFRGAGHSLDHLNHFTFLILTNAAMTFLCLGISSLMKTSEQASLLSIYFVGFQLPLSGAVLALPELVGSISRPFISAYWAWSGSIDSLESKYASAIKEVSSTPLEFTSTTCITVLSIQIVIGLIATYIGVKRHQWEH